LLPCHLTGRPVEMLRYLNIEGLLGRVHEFLKQMNAAYLF
ncbi:MAG: hypothetical protein ACI9ZV_000866, partial [Candidatus Azotimanducaceae bacterium]